MLLIFCIVFDYSSYLKYLFKIYKIISHILKKLVINQLITKYEIIFLF
jgi:hypothetical protein